MQQANTNISQLNKANLELPVRYCLYARKSSEEEERQALSIESQIREMTQMAERDNLNIVDVYKESHSAKDANQRPIFNKLIDDIKSGKFNGIVCWHPDRLSRNAPDLGTVVDLLDKKLLAEIRTYSQRFTNNPNEKFLLMILGSQSKLENDNRSINIKRGLRTRLEMGFWPAPAPCGYLNSNRTDQRCESFIDPARGPVVKQMFEKVGYDHISGRKIYYWLKEIKFTTRTGKALSLSNIYLILKNSFYYGAMEYPRGSGKWYQGKHEPLINKELYDSVQSQIVRSEILNKNREFALTKLIKCGHCGSGISAEEKIKKQKNGNVHHYIYYSCTKFNDHECKAGYIREEELIKQLKEMMNKIDLNEIGIKQRIKDSVERHKKFQADLLGTKSVIKVAAIDIRNYAKYILREGTIYEKRELLECFKSRLIPKDKILFLEQ